MEVAVSNMDVQVFACFASYANLDTFIKKE